jgi:hypothetical protein
MFEFYIANAFWELVFWGEKKESGAGLTFYSEKD